MSKRKRYGSKTLSKRRRVDPAFVFEHKELWVEDFETTAAFTLGTINRINPGLASLFQLLARIARNFEEYEFDYLRLRFGSRRANEKVGGSPAEGTIIVAVIHNSETRLTEFPNNKADMESIWGAKSFNPCYDFIFPIDVKHKNVLSRRYVRTNSAIPAKDNRLDDVGVLLIATVGSASTIEVGDLFLEYRIRLYKPYESPVLRSEFPEDPFNGKWEIWDLDTIDENTPFGNSTLRGGTIGTTLNSTTLSFPANLTGKCYRIIWWIADGGVPFIVGVNNPPATTPVNCTDTTTHWPDGSGNLTWSTLFSDPGNFAAAIWTIRIDADGATYSVITPWKVSVAPLAYGMLEITEISATMAPF